MSLAGRERLAYAFPDLSGQATLDCCGFACLIPESTTRISLGPIKTVILVILCMEALPLGAQSQAPMASMTAQVKVPSDIREEYRITPKY